jgi:hypothetical protein
MEGCSIAVITMLIVFFSRFSFRIWLIAPTKNYTLATVPEGKMTAVRWTVSMMWSMSITVCLSECSFSLDNAPRWLLNVGMP